MGGQWFQKHGPELAIGIGMVTIAGAGVGACFATAKTIRVIDRIEKDREAPLTRKEKFKVALPYFIGPAAGLILGSSFAIGGMNFGWKRTINIASAACFPEIFIVNSSSSSSTTTALLSVYCISYKIARDTDECFLLSFPLEFKPFTLNKYV